jgi:hypothetical protein
MLVAATVTLVLGMRRIALYILQRGPVLYTSMMSKDDPEKGYREYQGLCRSVTGYLPMTVAGVLYGAAVGAAPFVLGIWHDEIRLRASLALFMFIVNFVTGVAFFALIRFLISSVQLGGSVEVELWESRNPSVDFLLGAARRVSLLASVYIATCISSILFSVLPLRGLVMGYSLFACAVPTENLIRPRLPPIPRRFWRRPTPIQCDLSPTHAPDTSSRPVRSGARHTISTDKRADGNLEALLCGTGVPVVQATDLRDGFHLAAGSGLSLPRVGGVPLEREVRAGVMVIVEV